MILARKRVKRIQHHSKSLVSITVYGSALGRLLQPLVVYKFTHLCYEGWIVSGLTVLSTQGFLVNSSIRCFFLIFFILLLMVKEIAAQLCNSSQYQYNNSHLTLPFLKKKPTRMQLIE